MHIETLRPQEEVKTKTSRARAACRRGSASEDEDDKFECRWGECEMTLARGDDHKRVRI